MYLYFKIDDFEQFYKGKSVFHLHIYTLWVAVAYNNFVTTENVCTSQKNIYSESPSTSESI